MTDLYSIKSAMGIARYNRDLEITPQGIYIPHRKMYLNAETVSTIRYLYRLCTRQDEHIITLVDLINPE